MLQSPFMSSIIQKPHSQDRGQYKHAREPSSPWQTLVCSRHQPFQLRKLHSLLISRVERVPPTTELPNCPNQYNNIVLLTKCTVHTSQYTGCIQTTRDVIKTIRAHTLMVSREFVTCYLLFPFLLTLLKMAVQFNRPTKSPLSKVKVGKSDDMFCIKA